MREKPGTAAAERGWLARGAAAVLGCRGSSPQSGTFACKALGLCSSVLWK